MSSNEVGELEIALKFDEKNASDSPKAISNNGEKSVFKISRVFSTVSHATLKPCRPVQFELSSSVTLIILHNSQTLPDRLQS